MFDSISLSPQPSDFLPPTLINKNRMRDAELGGVGINNPSEGLMVQDWTFFVDADVIKCFAPNQTSPHTITSGNGIIEIAGAFDRNMNPCVAYIDNTGAYLYYFDTVTLGYIRLPINGARSLGLTQDDKRPDASTWSDVVLTWIGEGNVAYYSFQRDRFLISHAIPVQDPLTSEDVILTFGMDKGMRLQWSFGNLPTVG